MNALASYIDKYNNDQFDPTWPVPGGPGGTPTKY